MYGQPPPYGAPAYGAPAYGAPAYGAPPPTYYPPQQQQQAPGPMIINLAGNNNNNNGTGSPCPTCQHDTSSIPRKKIGGVAIAWCICLLLTAGGWGLCIYPLCTDSCKDTELVCIKCQTVKQTIHANCC